MPFATSIRYTSQLLPDAYDIDNSPQLQYRKEQLSQAVQMKKMELSKLMPGIRIGYYNTSMLGWQTTTHNTEQYFGSQDRFSWVNIGLGIPIFYGAQRSRIAAADRLRIQYSDELDAQKQLLASDQSNLQNARINLVKALNKYEMTLLPNSETIVNNANRKLQFGALNYLNWTIMMNQAIQVRAEYYEVIRQLNELEFEIEKIANTN